MIKAAPQTSPTHLLFMSGAPTAMFRAGKNSISESGNAVLHKIFRTL